MIDDVEKLLSKLLPLIPTIVAYWASYQLSREKSNREAKQDEFDRLNDENSRLSKELDHYHKLVASKEKENVKLQKEIIELRKYAAGAPTTGASSDKEDKNERK